MADVTTVKTSSVLINTALCNGKITADKGFPVTERGLCWSTVSGPTIVDSKLICGSDTGSFTGKMTGLTFNTSYFVRAYAISSEGTSYGNELSFKTMDKTMKDIQNNEYKIVQINNQVWMAQNLRTTNSPNGTPIEQVSDKAAWGALANTAKAYCWLNNDVNNAIAYGALYTYAATIYTSGSIIIFPPVSLKSLTPVLRITQGICPSGWHLPTVAEWDTLTTNLGGADVAGNKLKETGIVHWKTPNTGATNETSFTALPGGGRSSAGDFVSYYTNAIWWTSTAYDADNYKYMYMSYSDSNVASDYALKKHGLSVRCIKN